MISENSIAKFARKKNAQIEVFSETSSSLVLVSRKGDLKGKSFSKTRGYAVRIIKDKRMGFASFESENEFESALDRAETLSKMQEQSGYFFPSGKSRKSERFFDKNVESASEKECAEKISGMDKTAKEKKANPMAGFISLSVSEEELINSEGLKTVQKFSECYAGSHCAFGNSEAEESDACSFLNDLKTKELAKKSAETAREKENAKEIPSGKYEIILEPKAVRMLFGLFFPFNFSGESLRRKLTKLKPGEKIADERVSILDEPLLERGLNSADYDSEGFGMKRKALVENGKVNDFLYDMKSAVKSKNNELAGRGFRGSYSSPPTVSSSNIVVKEGNVGDAISECKKGINIEDFLTSGANDVTGDFAFPLFSAFLVKNGEKKHAVKNAVFRGNFFEALRSARFEKKSIRVGSVVSPKMVFNARIVA